jgi:hypothetical protein
VLRPSVYGWPCRRAVRVIATKHPRNDRTVVLLTVEWIGLQVEAQPNKPLHIICGWGRAKWRMLQRETGSGFYGAGFVFVGIANNTVSTGMQESMIRSPAFFGQITTMEGNGATDISISRLRNMARP